MLGTVKRAIVTKIVGYRSLRWLDVLAFPLIKLGYALRLLAWTGRADLRRHLLDVGEMPSHPKRIRLYEHLSDRYALESSAMWYMEFGVAKGESIRWWSERNGNPASRFVGHDSFEGLPEAWAMMPKGGFSTSGRLPASNDSRISFVKGWFKDTVGRGIVERPGDGHRLVANLDADLYGSTAVCLHALYPSLRDGDILIFDEFAYPMHEYRCFEDFREAFGVGLYLIAAVNCGDVVAFEVSMP